jgi:sugar porter (SP) family MFS transporter
MKPYHCRFIGMNKEYVMQKIIDEGLTPLMIFIAIAAALAGLLFGYDVGSISGALLFIKDTFNLTSAQQGLVVSAVPFGALVTSALGGKFNDFLGRKKNLILTAALFFIGALVCALANNVVTLGLGRLLLGFAIGIGSFSAPLYISEIAKQKYRGGLVTLNQLAIVTGICLSYGLNYALSAQGEWRLMLGFGVIPALILFVSAILLPESPRWLMTKKQNTAAKNILTRIHGEAEATKEYNKLNEVLQQEDNGGKANFRSFYKVLTLGILVSILTQAVGINAIIYYAPKIFSEAGLAKNTVDILATLGIGLVNVIFTLVAVRLLDQFGRRRLLLIGITGIVLSLVAIVAVFLVGTISPKMAWFVFGCFIVFIACQAIGTGPACWLIPSEIFPVKVRGLGMGLSVAFNWGTNVVVAFLFPIILNNWGGANAFLIFLIIAVIALIYFYMNVPETKGVSLEQIEENLNAGKRMRDLGV